MAIANYPIEFIQPLQVSNPGTSIGPETLLFEEKYVGYNQG